MSNEFSTEIDELPKPWNMIIPFLVRLFVWVLFFGLLYLMRSFSVLIFLTFVFSYIQAHGVEKLAPHFKRRSSAVVMVTLVFLGVLSSIGSYLVPQVISQAELFADNFKSYLVKLDGEVLVLSDSFPSLKAMVFKDNQEVLSEGNWEASKSPFAQAIYTLLGFHKSEEGKFVDFKELTSLLKNIGAPLLASLSSFFLALLFSFLIVLDLPRLTRSIIALRETKIGFIYDEVADSIVSFGTTLGHALEAQLFIAIINTVLTALAIFLFGLGKKLAFLSLIVFLCSFIPVAGVFLSSIPICLIVIEESGFKGAFFMALLIWGIHLIETYILNPKIFGERLHINPVLVLMILTAGGKLFGVWGLLLGVPILTYIFADAIRYKKIEE